MARVKYLVRTDLAPEHQDLLDESAINIRRAMVNSPGAARVQSRMMRYIRHESPLDPRLRELAILQVGYSTGCRYEFAHHVEQARLAGASDEDIAAIAGESAGQVTALDPLARAALRAARELTLNVSLSDKTYAELKRELDEACIVELIVAISFYNSTVRVLAGLRMDLEPEYEALLEGFRFPKV